MLNRPGSNTNKGKEKEKEEKENLFDIDRKPKTKVRVKVINRIREKKIKRREKKKENITNLPAVVDNKPEAKLMRHPLPHAGMPKVYDGQPTEKEVRAQRVSDHEQVKREVATLNRDNAGVINVHSIKAVDKVQPHHLKQASHEIYERRNEIRDIVGERIQEHPKLFKRGLKALGKVFQGAKKLTPKDMHAAKRVLVHIAMVSLMATSIVAMTMGAAPLAVVTSRMLFDIWMGNHKRKKDGYLKPKKPPAVEQKEEKEVGPIAKPRKPKAQKKWTEDDAEDANFTSVSASVFTDPDHNDVLDNVIVQISDLLNHQDIDDFKTLNKNMFGKVGQRDTATASTLDDYTQIFNAVSRLSTSRLSGNPGTLLFGQFYVNIEEIVELVERVLQVTPEDEIEDGQKVFHFNSASSLVTVGTSNDIIYFHFTEAQ